MCVIGCVCVCVSVRCQTPQKLLMVEASNFAHWCILSWAMLLSMFHDLEHKVKVTVKVKSSNIG